MIECIKNVFLAVVGFVRRMFHKSNGLMDTKLTNVSAEIVNQPENSPKTTKTIATIPIEPAKSLEMGVIMSETNNPTPKTQEQALLRALLVLGNRQNIWDLKIIYDWGHMEGSRWVEKEKKLYPFDTYLVLQGNNFWGIKKSSWWDKYIINPLDRQAYNRFDSVAEAVGFLDLFVKKGYPDSYANRNDYKLFFPLLKQGKWGAFCPGVNYADECIKRYEQLPDWKTLIGKIEVV